MPIETTSSSGLPVAPTKAPPRTRSAKARTDASTACTSATASRPSTTMGGAPAGARSAWCSTARPSVGLSALEPARMAAILAGTPAASASRTSSGSVSAVARWRELSSTALPRPRASGGSSKVSARARASSRSSSRRCGAPGASSASACARTAFHSTVPAMAWPPAAGIVVDISQEYSCGWVSRRKIRVFRRTRAQREYHGSDDAGLDLFDVANRLIFASDA